MSGRITSIALFLAGVICAALTMEAGLKSIAATPLWRVLPVIEPILGRPDWDTGYVFTPGVSGIWTRENRAALKITDLGLRGPAEITVEKTADRRRIALLGDSIAEGLQVDYAETFSAKMQDHFDRTGRGIDVINFAMAGNGPLRQLVRLEQRGYSFDPDIVLSVTGPFDFLTGEMRSDSINPGYVPDGDGGWTRGYAFRNRFSVRNADTPAGRLFVGTLQQVDVTRLLYLRSREPLPLLFGIQAAARPAAPSSVAPDVCHTANLERLQQLWQFGRPEADWQVLNKFFDELAASRSGRPVQLFYALREIPMPPAECYAARKQRKELIAAIELLLGRRGIIFIDLESRLIADGGEASTADLRHLYGFGLQIGRGHLNEEGHRRYAAALLSSIAPFLPR